MISKHGVNFRIRVPRSDRRMVKISTGTAHRATASAMKSMVTALRARHAWPILDAICAGDRTLGEVYDSYRTDPRLAAMTAALDDLDLEPLVAEWSTYLVARGTQSAARYVRQVRALVEKDIPFPRSKFTRKTISEHLAERTVSGSTKNRDRVALAQFARFLVERDVLAHNVVKDVRAAKPNPARMIYLERAQAQALVKALPQPFRALEALMLATGIEWQAAARLTRRDIDLDARTVHAQGSKNAWRNREVRIVAEWALPAITEHVRTLSPSAPVFSITHKAALNAHHDAISTLKMPPSTLHDHRHTFAVQALRDGLSPTTVARQLGHANAYLVFTTYGRFTVDARDYAAPIAQAEEAERPALMLKTGEK